MQLRIIILLFLLPLFTSAQKSDKKLASKIEQAIEDYNGDIGIYIKNLRTGKTVAINADTIFPTASIVKVPILTGIMDKILKGELQYDSSLVYKDSLLYAGSDILGSFKNDEKISLKKVIMLMLTTSDNTASLWLQSLADGGARINELMEEFGLKNTRVNSRVPGREQFRAIYQWGQTTPAEMGRLFEKIYNKEIFTPEICERMMRCLGRNFWDENEAISQIPPTIEVFSKNGCVNASRSEAMIVNAPHNPYVFCIFTRNNKDQSWTQDNEAWVMARKISKMLWDYYE
ncbi:MAG TPA: class A beta-lactamase-related serine hydrolase [Chitinophagaceae bacterium]|nr:class A beta-lactamase-related serine hydrolase [Chitinophagaceae bacterium]